MAADVLVRTPTGNVFRKRTVFPHPSPHSPNPRQHYACEAPEDPNVRETLFHSGCPKCLAALGAALANSNTLVLMAHGTSFYTPEVIGSADGI